MAVAVARACARCGAVRMYFLIHPLDLSVYEVESDQIDVADGGSVHSFIRTSASFKAIFMHSRFPGCPVNHETLVFLRLRQGKGWVWASSISVANDGKFPVQAPTLGNNFFFIWPVPVAINAYLEIKDRRRRQIGGANQFFDAVIRHPPCFSFVPNKAEPFAQRALPTARRLTSQQLTVAQRLFVASLVPHASPFAVRGAADKWCTRLGERDQTQFEAWRATNGPHPPTGGPTKRGDTPMARKGHRARREASCPLLTLPFDLLEKVLSFYVSGCIHDVDQLQAAVAICASVSKQFKHAAHSVAMGMLESVTSAARSLLDDSPGEPLAVQAVVHASCLTLRHAIALHPGDWKGYLGHRRSAATGGNSSSVASEQRRRLLWRTN